MLDAQTNFPEARLSHTRCCLCDLSSCLHSHFWLRVRFAIPAWLKFMSDLRMVRVRAQCEHHADAENCRVRAGRLDPQVETTCVHGFAENDSPCAGHDETALCNDSDNIYLDGQYLDLVGSWTADEHLPAWGFSSAVIQDRKGMTLGQLQGSTVFVRNDHSGWNDVHGQCLGRSILPVSMRSDVEAAAADHQDWDLLGIL